MADVIIIGVLIILIFVGLRSGITHFRGEGGCCGGGAAIKPKKKKLKNVLKQRTVIVEGMTCKQCKNRVESGLNDLEGVAAKVNLKKKTVVVSMETDISDEQIKTVLENAGYRVVDIR